MHRLIRLFSTSIGRKLVIAVTGAMLLGFLFAHMLGNMALLQGPDAINAYASWLQGHPLLLFMRIGLALVFVVHVYVAIRLSLENRAARPTKYATPQVFQSSFASRYMVFTGLLVVVFIVGHLLHFTFGVVQPENYGSLDPAGRHDVFAMIVNGFRNPWVCGSYIVAMNVIGFHLYHGARSLFQTVGINHTSYNSTIRGASIALVAIFVIGNCSLPILVYAGVIGLLGG